MSQSKTSIASLLASDILLAASIGLPWMMLSLFGDQTQPAQQIISPASMVWYAFGAVDYQMGIPTTTASVTIGVIYIVAALSIVGMSAPVIWGGFHGKVLKPFVPGVFLGSVVCGVLALLVWLVLPVIIGFGTLPPDIAFGPGILASLAGIVLAGFAYTDVSHSAKRRDA